MRVAFRVDASVVIGAGHVMRCLTLADELVRCGASVHFVTRAHAGHLAELIVARGFPCILLAPPVVGAVTSSTLAHAAWLGVSQAQDAEETAAAVAEAGVESFDWWVVDHYALDQDWALASRRLVRRMLVIDDLADRDHVCDLLLDQNLQAPGRYRKRLPHGGRTLLGPSFALLRNEFVEARRVVRDRDGSVRRILITFGGSDIDDLTGRALEAAGWLDETIAIDVVMGVNYSGRGRIEAMCARRNNLRCYSNVSNMAALMNDADLALGAGGVTTWERACLGLPSMVVTIAENQRPIVRSAAQRGLLRWIGDASQVTADVIADHLRWALDNPAALLSQSRCGRELVDGAGAGRVVEEMMS